MKEEAEEFLEEKALEDIVMKYSEFITFPIYLWKSKQVTKEVPLTEEGELSKSIFHSRYRTR